MADYQMRSYATAPKFDPIRIQDDAAKIAQRQQEYIKGLKETRDISLKYEAQLLDSFNRKMQKEREELSSDYQYKREAAKVVADQKRDVYNRQALLTKSLTGGQSTTNSHQSRHQQPR